MTSRAAQKVFVCACVFFVLGIPVPGWEVKDSANVCERNELVAAASSCANAYDVFLMSTRQKQLLMQLCGCVQSNA